MHTKKVFKIILGIIVVIIGIIIGIVPIFLQDKKNEIEDIKVNDYIKDTSINEDNVFSDVVDDSTNIVDQYLLVIEIPKIGLKRGVYNFTSSLNNIEQNITIMDESNLPDEVNGNVVLEAHSGTSNISYFNDLYKLKEEDLVYIYYQGIKYIYKVNNIYDVEKDGSVEVYRDLNKNTLTLITCKNDTDDKQMVVILYFVNQENY